MAMKNERAKRETRRRFEQWARNPQCHANVISAVHNVKMGAVARRENPQAPREGQSVFALARGNSFEAGLVRDGGDLLITALQRADVIDSLSADFADHRIAANGGTLADLDAAVEAGHAFLKSLAEGRVFNGAVSSLTVRIPRGIMLPEALLIIDVLAVQTHGERPVIAVGEIKTYADQGGHTSRSDLAAARAQMGLYVHALEVTLDGLGIARAVDVSVEGFLVLTYPGSNQPSVRSGEDLRYQLERARRGFELMEDSAQLMNGAYGAGDDDDPESLFDLVRHADTFFQDSCLSFCERADFCHANALAKGHGVALGDDVGRFLGGVTLDRVVQLLDGGRPANRAEHDLLVRLSDGLPVLP
ncbi:MAG: hypothetical protein B7C54_04390 [Acidimicrobiales bacterium mtb01]|nr:hypothetical protein [Actinomycetota bacterium]TEX46462.1 MAG: hypothetical protein B7C54_04390 [Acidimicrobiales bacterium mtb01]